MRQNIWNGHQTLADSWLLAHMLRFCVDDLSLYNVRDDRYDTHDRY